MTLSWQMKLRIAAVLCIGIGLIGFWAWPIAKPVDPFGAVLFSGLGIKGVLILMGLAFIAGLSSYFIAWPYGQRIGILAVPAGLAIWAIRSGNMAGQLLLNPTIAQRKSYLTSVLAESFLWLFMVAIGFLGVFLAGKLTGKTEKAQDKTTNEPVKAKYNVYLNAAIMVVLSGVIAHFLIGVLAQSVDLRDGRSIIVSQPAIGQIILAVMVAFGAAGFVVKRFFNGCYIWPMLASALVGFAAFAKFLGTKNLLEHSVQNWPVTFFSNAILSILPIQMIAFGCLGAVWGYWLAVRFDYWRHHELG